MNCEESPPGDDPERAGQSRGNDVSDETIFYECRDWLEQGWPRPASEMMVGAEAPLKAALRRIEACALVRQC